MRRRPLYLLVVTVVLATACGPDEPDDYQAREPAARTAERAPRPSRPDPGRTDQPRPEGQRTVLVLGNSIAAGYGLGEEYAFPAILQQKVDSLGWDVEVVNAGLSGETTAGGLSRVDWLLDQPVDVLILELGGNDGLRGIPPKVTRQNLQGIIEKTRDRYPDAAIILAGMQIPPNLGPDYARAFRDVFPAVADAEDAHLIPFLLEGVGGIAALNQPDGIHPTEEGHRIVAENVWQVLQPILAAELGLIDPEAVEAEDVAATS